MTPPKVGFDYSMYNRELIRQFHQLSRFLETTKLYKISQSIKVIDKSYFYDRLVGDYVVKGSMGTCQFKVISIKFLFFLC